MTWFYLAWSTEVTDASSISSTMKRIGSDAKSAAAELSQTSTQTRNDALLAAAEKISTQCELIIAANKVDVAAAERNEKSAAMLDRLLLDEARVNAMAESLHAIADFPDPLSKILAEWERPNGLVIQRRSVPLGVIGIIYESRPNVTADAAALCLKSGNAVILRGGSESFNSSHAIYQCLLEGIAEAGINTAAIQMVPTTDREAVGYMLSSMNQYIDVVVPRGGKSLIRRVVDEARVPVIGHLEGICHVYLHSSADPTMARELCVNAKMRRTGICGAAETLLVNADVADQLVPTVCQALVDSGCEIRGDKSVVELFPNAKPATEADWTTEYLDAVISVRVVGDLDDAISHIERFGSGHTECIVSSDESAAAEFLARVDSAIVLHNASTQFADGGEFGMGAEIGISTDRIHARGPVGAEQLTSYKYVVRGTGQTRPT